LPIRPDRETLPPSGGTVQAAIDHVVLWVADPLRAVAFYVDVLGFEGARVDDFREGRAPFPSVRLSPSALIDFMPDAFAPVLDGITGVEGSAGHRVNHLCLTVEHADFEAARARLAEAGVAMGVTMRDSFGARGSAPEAFYFADPDGNVIELRHYDRSEPT
jgi:catechol 2,3-dioxygenase-like lactoylglutathione lyase family enzyme